MSRKGRAASEGRGRRCNRATGNHQPPFRAFLHFHSCAFSLISSACFLWQATAFITSLGGKVPRCTPCTLVLGTVFEIKKGTRVLTHSPNAIHYRRTAHTAHSQRTRPSYLAVARCRLLSAYCCINLLPTANLLPANLLPPHFTISSLLYRCWMRSY